MTTGTFDHEMANRETAASGPAGTQSAGIAPAGAEPALFDPAPAMARLDIDSPVGRLRLVRSASGLSGVWFLEVGRGTPPAESLRDDPGDALLSEARRQLDDYWGGRRQRFDLPLAPVGTPFQRRVWQALLGIDHGHTSTYGAIAGGIGAPRAVRAVGAAIGRNPIAIVIPCHRVLGGDGSLTGFAGGLDRKVQLLRGEGAWI